MNKTKWTKEEEDILVQAIKSYPHNIKTACSIAASKINRSERACSLHWYQVLSKNKKLGVTFLVVGNKSIVKNKKIIKPKSKIQPIKTRFNLLTRILKLFKK